MKNNNITLKLNLRIVCVVLLLIIAGMLAVWQPWSSDNAVTRKITITGDATVKATPDEFVFYPTFERTGTDLSALRDELNAFGNQLLNDIQKLGIAKSDIKLNSSSYENYGDTITADKDQTFTLQVTITTHDQTKAQKVQDYLASTDAKGQLTSQPTFSDAKRKQLENTARQQALADARKKAEQTASNVGAKLGKVLEVNDQSTGGGIMPLTAAGSNLSMDSKAGLPVTPGTDELTSTVQVVFELK